MTAPLLVLTGQLASGKSTVAGRVLREFSRGVHADVDAVREMVVSGRADPVDWTKETTRQFGWPSLPRWRWPRSTTAGFAVVIEGSVDPSWCPWLWPRPGWRVAPPVSCCAHGWRSRWSATLLRGASRSTPPCWSPPSAGSTPTWPVRLRAGWTVIGNSDEPVAATVARILQSWVR